MVDLWVNNTLSDSTVLHVVKWSGSFATSRIGAVKACWPSCVAAIVMFKDNYSSRYQAGHLRLACNLFPSVIFNYNWWYFARQIQWTAYSCFWRRSICFSFLQLPMPRSRSALVQIGVWYFCFEVNVGYISWSVLHPPRIARVCSLPLYTPYLGAEYNCVSRLNQYQKYVIKCMVNWRNAYTGVLGNLDDMHVDRGRVCLFSFSTTRILMYSRFFIMRVWRCMKFLLHNWCLDI